MGQQLFDGELLMGRVWQCDFLCALHRNMNKSVKILCNIKWCPALIVFVLCIFQFTHKMFDQRIKEWDGLGYLLNAVMVPILPINNYNTLLSFCLSYFARA